MSKAGYNVTTEGEVSLTAATAKTVLGVLGDAAVGIDLGGFSVDFDGVTSTAESALIEVCYCTFATNVPGTNSTAATVAQTYGRTLASGTTAAKNWTTEPTVLTVVRGFALDPNKGFIYYDWPLGQTPDSAVADGFAIRVTAPASVACRAGMWFEHV